ncbi:MAG: GGDEF domain-containing protein [Hyphomonas sp.]|nr:GGDEF domain-containing protein [Hyphomonas sp.]
MSIPRLIAVSAWHGATIAYIVVALLRLPQPATKHRLISALLMLTALAIMARPIVAAIVRLDRNQSAVEQLETYGFIVSLIYLTAVFTLAAAIFFHVMSEQIVRYRDAAATDSLTGLLNRRGFFEAVEPITTFPAAIIMLDIDRFKSINDCFGHEVGDRVIAKIGDLLDQTIQPPHVSARLGGEEFAIVLLRSEPLAANAVAQSLRTAIELELTDMLCWDRPVTASFGVAPIETSELDNALVQADRALYRAKSEGRNRVCIAETTERSIIMDLADDKGGRAPSARPLSG